MYLGRGVRKGPPYVFLGGTLPKEEGRTAFRPQPSRCATGMDAPLLSGYMREGEG